MAGSGIVNKDLEIIRQLGLISMLRGQDGTGVYQVNSRTLNEKYNGELLCKSRQEFSYFDWFHRYGKDGEERLMNSVYSDIVMGHVRAATVGNINDDNAHPFAFPELVGAHNGTLRDKKYHDAEKTDSELMFLDVSKRGLEPVLSTLDPESAYAIVLFDKQTKELVFTRNSKRPLYFSVLKGRNVMYWASERAMLDLVLGRCGEDYQTFFFDAGFIYKTTTNKISSKNTAFWSKTRIHGEEKPVVTVTLEKKKPDLLNLPWVSDYQDAKDKSIPVIHERRKPGKIVHQECNTCQFHMNLLEQYAGRSNGDGSYTCETCVTVENYESREAHVG